MVDLEEQKKRVEIQKKKIQVKEKLLKEKERQRKFRRTAEVVEVAFAAKIDQLDDVVLLGAFLEIAERAQNSENVNIWRNLGEAHLQGKKEISEQLLAISFEADPEKEIKAQLRSMQFRWNPFRKEFCGYGNQKELESLLKEANCNIEIIP